MKERLERLRSKLGVQWKELAEMLDISVPMIGCLRRGERNPSPRVELRIAALEKGDVALHKVSNAAAAESGKCLNCTDKDRELAVLRAELLEARAVIRDLAAALA